MALTDFQDIKLSFKSPSILMVDNYDSFTYLLVDYLKVLGSRVDVIKNDELDPIEIKVENYDAIVISPGPKSPVSAGISVSTIAKYFNRIPILGVCLGHQSIGYAFGGSIIHAQEIIHGKTSRIFHKGDWLFYGVESPFLATRYHSLVIDPDSIPNELMVIAESEDGAIMAIRHKYLPTYGIQFHPESILTSSGIRILANFLEISNISKIKNNP